MLQRIWKYDICPIELTHSTAQHRAISNDRLSIAHGFDPYTTPFRMKVARCLKTPMLMVALVTLLACGVCLGKDSCFDCHRVMEGTSLKFTNDIHFAKEISCANCHGGDRNESAQNIAMNASRGFKVRVARQGVPEFCGNCHSDTNFMGKFNPHEPTDQLAEYQTSVHGKLLAAGRKRAAECGDCHGVHNTRAVNDPLSTASPQRISQTCAKCHTTTGEAFAESPHARVFNDQRQPGCTVCHSAHGTASATTAMLTGSTSVCTPCHQAGSEAAKVADTMAQYLSRLESAGPESKDALARARVALHSMNFAKLKQAAETVSSPPQPAAQ
jgi:predicted CXXCH cytochrome family protein